MDLWQQSVAPHLICTGGFEDDRMSAAAVCGRFAAELGVPPDRIWLADGSSNTGEDAYRVAEIVRENGWRSVVLVSHPLHLFRARWLLRRAGVSAVPARPAPIHSASYRRCDSGTLPAKPAQWCLRRLKAMASCPPN